MLVYLVQIVLVLSLFLSFFICFLYLLSNRRLLVCVYRPSHRHSTGHSHSGDVESDEEKRRDYQVRRMDGG